MFINSYSSKNNPFLSLYCGKLGNKFLIKLDNYNGIEKELIFIYNLEEKEKAEEKALELIRKYDLAKEK